MMWDVEWDSVSTQAELYQIIISHILLYQDNGCLPLFVFLPILHLFEQKVGPSLDQFGEARFVHGPTIFTFPPDLEKSDGVGRPTPPEFFLRQIDYFPHYTA